MSVFLQKITIGISFFKLPIASPVQKILHPHSAHFPEIWREILCQGTSVCLKTDKQIKSVSSTAAIIVPLQILEFI